MPESFNVSVDLGGIAYNGMGTWADDAGFSAEL
jgi:hypothetical protein